MSAIRTHPEITPQRPHCVAGVGGFQSHTPCNRCVRFATTVASGHATLATKQDATLYLGRTFTGWIAPALPGARSGRDVRFIARPPHRTVRAAFPHTAPTSGV